MMNLKKRVYLSFTTYVVIALNAIFAFFFANSLSSLLYWYLMILIGSGFGTLDVVMKLTGTKRKYDLLLFNGVPSLLLPISILFFKSRGLFLLTVVLHSVCMVGYVLYFYRKSGGTPMIESQDKL
ncbi:hypothetical protein K4L44_17460 [Halosquirtibacter laminarini]|uniref:Uncharacterized protein n=1 Tax=Halosquirtibacter laminarini TaxID=3374600 RepID=A0AC61NR25_9BACT|nr:hypothetical protein K4L44_17460 [Prolixibacteraceae bacterium]